MELRLFRDVTPELWKLYQESFPVCEQRYLERHKEVLNEANFQPYVIDNEGETVGLLFAWVWNNCFYIEHLATNPAVRGGGIGALAVRAAQAVAEKEGRVLILEIDPPVTEIAQRRQGFYERLGLILNNEHEHIHPSYRKGETPYLLKIMSWPRPITVAEFREFQKNAFSVL